MKNEEHEDEIIQIQNTTFYTWKIESVELTHFNYEDNAGVTHVHTILSSGKIMFRWLK